MRTYTPNTIFTPKEVKEHPAVACHLLHHFRTLEKTLHNDNVVETWDESHSDCLINQLLTLEERKELLLSGSYPLFHDIFLRKSHAGQQIVAIGIEDQRIAQCIGRPEIWHQGKQLYFTDSLIHEYQSLPFKKRIDLGFGFLLRIYLIDSSPTMQFQEGDALELRWTQEPLSFTRTVYLQSYPWVQDSPKLTLQTLQKNESLQWIRDWILYHHRIHGVERVLLYDNGSDNKEELAELLTSLESETLEICLIPWRISYAPFALSECQLGAITHAYHWLWDKSSWSIHCDIDEYLINRTGVSLQQYLCRPSTYLHSALLLPDVEVTNFYTAQRESIAATDFQYVADSIVSAKPIYRGAEEIYIATPHVAYSCVGWWASLLATITQGFRNTRKSSLTSTKSRQPNRFKILLSFISIQYMRWRPEQPAKNSREKCLGGLYWFLKLIPKRILKFFFMYRRKEWGLYFYHYTGLSNDWKRQRYAQALPPTASPPADTHKDEQVREIFKKAGIGEYSK